MSDFVLERLSARLASRRVPLRLGVAALIGRLVVATSPAARGACGGLGGRCRKRQDCCAGARCSHRRCKCRRGRVNCGETGRCVDLKSDPDHCGQCGHACPDGRGCDNGVCCKTGETGCSGVCCSRLEQCLPKGVPGEDVCCQAENVFVRCDNAFIQLRDGHYVCLAPIDLADRYGQICCPAESLCGDFCCEPVVVGDTSVCTTESLTCETGSNYPASYVRPRGRGPN
ncbi:MAG: hypothetical protein U0031_15150 [Thermomicrobiales bacterium]